MCNRIIISHECKHFIHHSWLSSYIRTLSTNTTQKQITLSTNTNIEQSTQKQITLSANTIIEKTLIALFG